MSFLELLKNSALARHTKKAIYQPTKYPVDRHAFRASALTTISTDHSILYYDCSKHVVPPVWDGQPLRHVRFESLDDRFGLMDVVGEESQAERDILLSKIKAALDLKKNPVYAFKRVPFPYLYGQFLQPSTANNSQQQCYNTPRKRELPVKIGPLNATASIPETLFMTSAGKPGLHPFVPLELHLKPKGGYFLRVLMIPARINND